MRAGSISRSLVEVRPNGYPEWLASPPDAEFVQGVLAQLPWYHHPTRLDNLDREGSRRWYAAKAIEHYWSRNVRLMQIETRGQERSGTAVPNFRDSVAQLIFEQFEDDEQVFSSFCSGSGSGSGRSDSGDIGVIHDSEAQ